MFKGNQVHIAQLLFLKHLNFDRLCLADTKGCRIYNVINIGNWWWDTPNQFLAGATLVPVICASAKAQWTKCWGNQHSGPLNIKIGNILKDICRAPKKQVWILVHLIPCPPTDAKHIEEASHSAVGNVLSTLRLIDITGPYLKLDCVDEFMRKYHPVFLHRSRTIQNTSCLVKPHIPIG
jgi:hypothetical protein